MKKCMMMSIVLSSLIGGCTTTEPQVLASEDNVQLGLAYLQQGDVVLAKEKLLLALQEDSHNSQALDAMAYFDEKTANKTEAEKYYQKAIKLAPHDGAVFNNYGTFLCREHKPQEAEQMFLKAVDMPDYLNTGEAYKNAGLCALTIPDKAKAQYYFQKALEKDPKIHE